MTDNKIILTHPIFPYYIEGELVCHDCGVELSKDSLLIVCCLYNNTQYNICNGCYSNYIVRGD